MIWVEMLFIFQHSIESSYKFMHGNHNDFLVRKSLLSSFLKVLFKVAIMSYYRGCHKPKYSSEMLVSSFRNFAFASVFVTFIYSSVNSIVGNKSFGFFKSFNFSNFSYKMQYCFLTKPFNRAKKLNGLCSTAVLTQRAKMLCQDSFFLLQIKQILRGRSFS